LLRDLGKVPAPPQIDAVLSVIARNAPDILLLSGIDHDAGGHALAVLQRRLGDAGHPMPHAFAAAPNWGVPTGLDIDGDGDANGPEDAQAFGTFRGQGGMALLSRFPVAPQGAQVFADLLWSDFPAADTPFGAADPVASVLRLSASGHWDVPVKLPGGAITRLLALHAVPPVFDGPEDRNGRRNADQLRFWSDYLEGWHPETGTAPTPRHAIVIGTLNADPRDGEARRGALRRLLDHPRLQDPKPASAGGAAATREQGGSNLRHGGDPALDTVDWPEARGSDPGNLRVDYILPDRGFDVAGAGVFWPEEGPDAELAARASRHRLVWVDLSIPRAP
jgi:hypothetical protein